MKIKFSFSLLFIFIVFIIGCSKNKETDSKPTDSLSIKQDTAQFPPETIAKLDSVLNSFMQNTGIPGIAGGIWIPGKGEYIFTKGVSELGTNNPRTLDQHIRIGSITKTFVSTVILQLCDEGKMSLDDKLSKFYPDYPNSDRVDMRMLMNMTTGLKDYLELPGPDSAFYYIRDTKFTNDELYNMTVDLQPLFAPGEKGKWDYSNTNYFLLGLIIEKVTGNSWQDEITNRLIKKLDLKNTFVPSTPEMPSPYAHGYMKNQNTGEAINVTLLEPSMGGPAGNMISNINDLKIWGRALGTGVLLSDSMQAERMKFFAGFPEASNLSYGLGILNVDGFIGHDGSIPGYHTSVYYSNEHNALIIVSVNEFGKPGGEADRIFTGLIKVLYPDLKGFPEQ